mgnify:CR=1 FL=1
MTVGGHAADRNQANENNINCVIGCGAIGLGAILGLASKNCHEVIAVDVDGGGLALAHRFNVTDMVNSKSQDLHTELGKLYQWPGPKCNYQNSR